MPLLRNKTTIWVIVSVTVLASTSHNNNNTTIIIARSSLTPLNGLAATRIPDRVPAPASDSASVSDCGKLSSFLANALSADFNMSLTSKQTRHLRSLAHSLKPVVMVGNAGLSEAVIREIDLSLTHHELIKVKISAADRDERKTLIQKVCDSTQCECAQSIGHTAILYRAAKKPVIQLPQD